MPTVGPFAHTPLSLCLCRSGLQWLHLLCECEDNGIADTTRNDGAGLLTGFSPYDAAKVPVWLSLKARSQFNTAADAFFYDTDALNEAERSALAARAQPEGEIVMVGPRNGMRPACVTYPDLEKFLGAVKDKPDTVVITGVGSSALGTAALARNVADCMGHAVIGVVSGYGLADLAGEGLGGWFGLGAANAISRTAAQILSTMEKLQQLGLGGATTTGRASANGTGMTLGNMASGFLGGVTDSDVLKDLIEEIPGIRYVIGHSKGNFVIDNALKGLSAARRKELKVLTLGAPIYLPIDVERLQVIGGLDTLGWLNTRAPWGEFSIQPMATHVVKPGLFGLNLKQALIEAGMCR